MHGVRSRPSVRRPRYYGFPPPHPRVSGGRSLPVLVFDANAALWDWWRSRSRERLRHLARLGRMSMLPLRRRKGHGVDRAGFVEERHLRWRSAPTGGQACTTWLETAMS